MYAWGSTVHGELGLGGIEDEHILAPRALEWFGANNVKQAACGNTHSLLLTAEGKVYSCGNNDYGQLGHDQPRKRPRMSMCNQVLALDAYHISHVACGYSHSMALNEWGQIFTWGSDIYGQLGHQLGQQTQPTPKILKALATLNVVQIVCGKNHSIALTSGGDIYAWGANDHGQLGIGTTTPSEPSPSIVSALAGIPIAQIACGSNHTFAVSKSGAVFGWGKNSRGQLGLNDTLSKSFPVQLRTLRNIRVRYIECGDEFSTFLTLDGGVFSCGAGMYGQLGHGNTANEILPKKVLELMGSTITQVSCGGRHTLALVPSRSRVYSFGLGGSGQLGGNNPANASTPQVVLGPWVSTSSFTINQSSQPQCVIYRIFAGGDHSFATVTDRNDNILPFDSREIQPKMQILELNFDYLHNCLRIPSNGTVDQEVLLYLETVFKSLACINGSFLLNNDDHYCCSSKHHGVNLEMTERTFSIIGRCENQTIKDLIWTSVTEELLGKLVPSPPDVETLRIYLSLPFYHEFNNCKQYNKLHRKFAQNVLGLQPAAQRIVGLWWSTLKSDYFERLVNNFKNVVCYIIRNQRIQPNKTISYDLSLLSMLDVLMFLHKINCTVENTKVPYDTFHLPELSEFLDVRVDYILWLTDTSNKLFLCNYPFLFDANAKVELLQTDQSIQMQSAMNAAAQRAFMALLFQPNALQGVHQFLVLNVTREAIVSDTLRELIEVDSNDLKKPLKVKFYGEEAEDAGGVRKEFFMLLLREILDPKYGMFKEYEDTRTIWFTENPFEDSMMYLLIGLICGLAIYNFTIIDLPFPLALYKKLLKEPVTLNDLKDLSPTIANSLKSILEYDQPDFEEVFGLNFEISRDAFGEQTIVHLKPNGDHTPVTQENKKEYVDLYVDYILNKAVSSQYEPFYHGFMKVCGGRVLQLFHSHELMAVVVGNENYDWHALEESAEYKNGYSSSDQTIRWFWEVIHEMSLEDKKKFLLYLTGCDRIPIQGMKAIQIVIQPTTDEKYLPVAHTCFNLLDLPRYKTKERLKYKLIQAIQQTEGFSLV
ncbi:hypothetical protein RI129_001969 [Pyrocoelia pectoralis]|uniref:HECT domain-containing protein n=1 Tax=Pyrocoelia pectoralis TaxID=417401 RepID=A0AAN7VQ47_9COLE